MKLTKKNYYSKLADKKFMSYSQYKDFCKCPAMAMAKIKGEWEQEQSDSMLVGSYVDAWLDGKLDDFKVEHPEIFTKKGELRSDFVKAQEICEVIKDDHYLYELLKGRRQKIVTGTIAGVPFKGKIDSLKQDMIVDGKVLKDCEEVWSDGEKQPFYKGNRYDIQAAIYQKLYQQMTGKKLPFVLGIVTKEKVPDKRLVKIQDIVIEDALQEIIVNAPVFQSMKDGKEKVYGCGKCDYCKSIKKLSEGDIEEL